MNGPSKRDWLEAFLADMGERPEGTQLDRIDNNKGYEPGNCRWATLKQQNRNRRGNRFLTLNGRTLTVAGWAEELGLRAGTVYSRLYRGKSVEEALRA